MGARAQAQWLWRMGLVALQHVRSSQIRFGTHVFCIGRQILSHWAIRESPGWVSFWTNLFLSLFSSKHHFWASFCPSLLLPLSWLEILTSLYLHLAISHSRAPIYSSPRVSASTHILLTLQSLNQAQNFLPTSRPLYSPTGKTIALTRRIFVGKVMSLLFNMLSRLSWLFFQGASIFKFHGFSHHLQWFWSPKR